MTIGPNAEMELVTWTLKATSLAELFCITEKSDYQQNFNILPGP